jgi:hypothetical protein
LPLDVTADAGDALVDESALLKVELGLMYRWSFNRGANVDVDGFIDFDVEDASLRWTFWKDPRASILIDTWTN